MQGTCEVQQFTPPDGFQWFYRTAIFFIIGARKIWLSIYDQRFRVRCSLSVFSVKLTQADVRFFNCWRTISNMLIRGLEHVIALSWTCDCTVSNMRMRGLEHVIALSWTCECALSNLRARTLGLASAHSRACECALSGLRVRSLGPASARSFLCARVDHDLLELYCVWYREFLRVVFHCVAFLKNCAINTFLTILYIK